jgi:hypothetical protein
VEAYHAGSIRTQLYQKVRGNTPQCGFEARHAPVQCLIADGLSVRQMQWRLPFTMQHWSQGCRVQVTAVLPKVWFWH